MAVPLRAPCVLACGRLWPAAGRGNGVQVPYGDTLDISHMETR